MSTIELMSNWIQISVNISILIGFIIGWCIYFKKIKKIKTDINFMKSKLFQIEAILPIEKSIDALLSSKTNQDGRIVQMIVQTKDGKVIDSTKQSIDEYFVHEKKVLKEKISELESCLLEIDIP